MNLINLKNKRGFTLVELLIVIVILGIIAALVLPRLVSQPEKARVAEAGNSLGILGRTLSGASQMRGGVWLDIGTAANQNALGLDGTPNVVGGSWTYTSASGTPNIVVATRTANNSVPAICNGAGNTISLNASTGVYTGGGCYQAGAQYDANVLLKGQ